MNGNGMSSRVQMDPEALKNLVSEVKETLAQDFIQPAEKDNTFTAADLWKIERNRRRATGAGRRLAH